MLALFPDMGGTFINLKILSILKALSDLEIDQQIKNVDWNHVEIQGHKFQFRYWQFKEDRQEKRYPQGEVISPLL